MKMYRYYYCRGCNQIIVRELKTKYSHCNTVDKKVKLIKVSKDVYEYLKLLEIYE